MRVTPAASVCCSGLLLALPPRFYFHFVHHRPCPVPFFGCDAPLSPFTLEKKRKKRQPSTGCRQHSQIRQKHHPETRFSGAGWDVEERANTFPPQQSPSPPPRPLYSLSPAVPELRELLLPIRAPRPHGEQQASAPKKQRRLPAEPARRRRRRRGRRRRARERDRRPHPEGLRRRWRRRRRRRRAG